MGILLNEKLMIVLIVMMLVMTIAFIADMRQKRKLYRRYDLFMRGKNAESLEKNIEELERTTNMLKSRDMANRDLLMVLSRGISVSMQKTSIVKDNALPGMGGQSSFVLAMLDQQDTGFLLNAMHSRTSCYVYIKQIYQGRPEAELSKEEKDALVLAMAKKSKYFGEDDTPEELEYMNMGKNPVQNSARV